MSIALSLLAIFVSVVYSGYLQLQIIQMEKQTDKMLEMLFDVVSRQEAEINKIKNVAHWDTWQSQRCRTP